MMEFVTSDIPDSACPSCGKVLDAATSTGERATPDPGDVSICIQCGHLMVFGDDLKLRAPTDEEMVRFAGDERILKIQKARGRAVSS